MTIKKILRFFLPRMIVPQRIWAGPLRGYTIVTSWHDYPAAILGRTERPLLDWFARNVHPGETWLDIGAHYGYTAIALSRLAGVQGRVFAFEPMLATAGYLSQTRQLNHFMQLNILPLALAAPDTLEIVRLPVTRGMVDSTLEDPAARSGSPAWEETFVAARLDWLWPQISGEMEGIDGIKIDVQGMEISVIRGMLSVLKRRHPRLVVEFHLGVDRKEILDLIESAGYDRRAEPVEPVTGEAEPAYLDNRSYAFSPKKRRAKK